MFFMNRSVEGNTYLHSSISIGNNKEYLTAVFIQVLTLVM